MTKKQFIRIFKNDLLKQIEEFELIPPQTIHNMNILYSYIDKVYERVKEKIYIKDIGRIFFHFKLYEDNYYYDVFDIFEVNVYIPFKIDEIYSFTIDIDSWEC